MIIRQEREEDYDEVFRVVQTSFAGAEHSDGKEQHLVAALRMSSAFVSELSLVAEADGKIIGYILFTKIKIGESAELALAPLAVLPSYQRQGVGKALIAAGHRIAKEMGYAYSVVLGSGQYYSRFGYLPAKQFGIRAPFDDVPDENFMAVDLQGGSEERNGVVEYAKEFFEV